MSNHAYERDATVLRADSSVSRGVSGGSGSGEADAPRVLKQRFVLEERLGSGGMGTVFRAKDLRKVEARDRQPYLAIKVLNNDFREHPEAFIALQREAAKSQAVSHPNIVTIFDFDKDGDVPFITMELLEGQELAQMLRAHPNGLPDPLAWDVIRGLCAGLEHAHTNGIVHSDFKPGNVFVSPKNVPKILDFGIARAVQLSESADDDTLFDPTRLAALTPAYASREMLAGDNPEARDDLYSLGVVIYQILTGRHPYGRLAADEAAKEGLRPEKPKRLSRRQWRGLARCLAFSRQDRPADLAEVERLLLQPAPWRSRSAIAAAAAFALAFGINALIGDAELTEVKEEVRQTTLADAQRARLSALLAEPVFDAAWEQLLAQEFKTLERLGGAAGAVEALRERIAATYTARIEGSADIDAMLALLERGEAYAPLPEAREVLKTRMVERVHGHLADYREGPEWLHGLESALDLLRLAFAGDARLAEIELDITESLELLVERAVAARSLGEADALLGVVEPLLFDAPTVERLRTEIVDTRRQLAASERARRLDEARAERREQLDALLAQSCLRIDLEAIARLFETAGEGSDAGIAERLRGCLSQLAELDPDRASVLERDAQRLFGPELLAGSNVSVDPCSLSYLVGNGQHGGRGGYCVDRLADGDSGPRLVVLPSADGSGRFAMSKHEISWAHYKHYCVVTGACDPASLGDDRLPVSGIALDAVRAYARWLSETTGHTYRLPTVDEWRWAAQGDPDPNRNCRVQIDGLQRGLAALPASSGQGNRFGLVHMLGNVQEWAVDAQGVHAVGGAYTDPISDCVVQTARAHGGEAAANTGFRLVREVS